MRASLLLVLPLLSLACAVATDPPSEEVGRARQALGGQLTSANRPPCLSDRPCPSELYAYSNFIHFAFTNANGNNNIAWGITDAWHGPTVPNSSGILDVQNPQVGALYDFSAQDCVTHWFAPSTCSPWSEKRFIYVPPYNTWWDDTDDPATSSIPKWVAGSEPVAGGGTRFFQACSVHYAGGQHVGKYFDGYCHIGWGGREVSLTGSMVMTAVWCGVEWTSLFYGAVGDDAIVAGYENGQPQYLCRAFFAGGMHPGKFVAGGCNFAWGGAEQRNTVSYQMLTRTHVDTCTGWDPPLTY